MRSVSCVSLLLLSADAFAPNSNIQSNNNAIASKTQRQALWRHWIPETDAWDAEMESESSEPAEDSRVVEVEQVVEAEQGSMLKTALATSLLAAVLAIAPNAGIAVSGGGLDFAGLDISGQDFADKNYKGKDFTQVIAKGTNFAKSNLQGCRFYKAYLVNADFSDADIRGAAMEDTSMDGASLKNAIAVGSYFGDSILETKTVENADFTDAQFPVKALPQLCEREDMKGTNPVTGADTRESAMCL
mmetsp:Transcript_15168/g.37190  ORF Transcript_15168/g.37190 Transcript_15168/m.37190 type:complete len:245 (-) Transcript_15168:2368-3102(-)|eukprot:CAMPEP_0113637320 /NCGR_PEP_ID=MMETSP0017_2-20120614/19531_1 /TAXON_ID=2856 /ORGANISM="Cylindrotheca closterium" /LENGTH=244 /DNA_ID=CAMNT_0000548335 /DNA_START=139 /DNA_END=873 /DNA_ORIENTATION=- /assembly_acc=CAM_ASM_000147